SGTPPAVTYTPNSDYTGTDSFTFTANDGTATSTAATISININAVVPDNTVPNALAQSVTTLQNQAANITLTGTDSDGDSLTFAIASSPSHGTLSGTPPAATYTPDSDYTGSDSFTFTANDGMATSTAATVSINIDPGNTAPNALVQFVTTLKNQAANITLTGTDNDGDSITFAIASNPSHGTLSGTPPAVTYTP
ncbi:MAG: adhesin, partial [Planctomycetes bacterium]|nr:adhesin [Planctomycetota bacterium]